MVILQGIAAVALTLAIGDRLGEKDYGSMIFVVFNNIFHWLAFGSMIGWPESQDILLGIVLFSVAMLLGDLVKVYWLFTTDFSVSERLQQVPRLGLIFGTLLFVVIYLSNAVIAIVLHSE